MASVMMVMTVLPLQMLCCLLRHFFFITEVSKKDPSPLKLASQSRYSLPCVTSKLVEVSLEQRSEFTFPVQSGLGSGDLDLEKDVVWTMDGL